MRKRQDISNILYTGGYFTLLSLPILVTSHVIHYGDTQPPHYSTRHNRVNSIYFEIEDFNFENFWAEIKSRFRHNNSYSILVKVRMTNIDEISLFCMIDDQFGVYFEDSDYVKDILHKRFETLCDRLEFYMCKYSADKVTLIQVMYILNNSLAKLRLKNINKVYLDKNIINVTKTKSNFSDKFIPLSINEIYYGKPISFETTNNSISNLIINGIDFGDLIKKEYELKNKKAFIPLSDKTRFYLYAIKDKQYVIVIRDIDANKSRKDVYNMHGFKVLNNVIDEKLSNDSFIRQIDNSKFLFENGIVKKKILPVKLPILNSKPSKYRGMPNTYIGSFDIETYKDSDGKSKVYALGFTTLQKFKDNKV